MNEPMTAEGRAHWFDMTTHSGGEALHPMWVEHLRTVITAIEQAAYRKGKEEGLAAARSLVTPLANAYHDKPDVPYEYHRDAEELIAAIDALRSESGS